MQIAEKKLPIRVTLISPTRVNTEFGQTGESPNLDKTVSAGCYRPGILPAGTHIKHTVIGFR